MLEEFINCENNSMSLDDVWKSLITIDSNGNSAIRVTENADSGVPFYNCDNTATPFQAAILKAVVIVDGKPALNLAVVTTAP